MKKLPRKIVFVFLTTIVFCISCVLKKKNPDAGEINAIGLKQGNVILCGPPGKQFGTVKFITSCSGKSTKDFDLAIALLHSFEYDEAEKVFAKIIKEEPGCAMAYWGVAMCNYHQVWPSPPSAAELEKGNKAITIAESLQSSGKESEYIHALGLFYNDWKSADHNTRSQKFLKAMEKLYLQYPDDKEVAIFYALTLDGTADPADKSYQNQKKAGNILTALYPGEPNHPGIVHYIIHSYDYPELAVLALPAARQYASIAPSSAHAQHMPSHIFTRLGLWDESIRSNLVSTDAAKCYAENAGIKGHWDEELHGMDYLVYAYLQKAENDLAKAQNEYLRTIDHVYPVNFKVAYAFAAIPTRYFLENKMWKEAASLQLHPKKFPWINFPWQEAIFHFAKLLGAAHTGAIDSAKHELKNLNRLYDTLIVQKDVYKANQVMIQVKTGEAWILLAENKVNQAIQLMKAAAEMEDKTEKSPVTPGEVIPAKELLADMLLQVNIFDGALEAYEDDLKIHPNRFNGLYGAGLASEKLNKIKKAKEYYYKLTAVANSSHSQRPELIAARQFLNRNIIANPDRQ